MPNDFTGKFPFVTLSDSVIRRMMISSLLDLFHKTEMPQRNEKIHHRGEQGDGVMPDFLLAPKKRKRMTKKEIEEGKYTAKLLLKGLHRLCTGTVTKPACH